MSTSEVGKLLMLIKAYYPTWNPSLPMETIANAWTTLLKDYDAKIINDALLMYVSKGEHFPPSNPGELTSLLVDVRSDGMTEMGAWDLVLKAIRNGNYRAEEEFAGLPPVVKKAVGSAAQIQSWAALPSSEVHTVVQSNFMRSYRAAVTRESDQAKFPEHLRQISEPVVEVIETKAEPETSSGNVPMPEDFLSKLNGLLAKKGAD